MFGLFKKKKEEIPTLDPEEIHRALLTSSINYLVIAKQDELIPIENIDGVRAEYNSLCNFGLGSSKNAQILKAKIDTVNSKLQQVNLAKNIIIYINSLKRVYGSKVFLVSNDAFNAICTKYNLSIGMLRDYYGTIPNENLEELKSYKAIETSYKKKDFLSTIFNFNENMYYVTKASPIRGEEEQVRQFLSSIHNIVKQKTQYLVPLFLGNCENTPEEFKYISIDSTELKPNEFFVACPEKYLYSEVDISVVPLDPIVFRECPYGKVIFTMWGKEAEDKVLEEFKKLNNLI